MSAGPEDSAPKGGAAGPLAAYRALLSDAAEGILADPDQEAAAARLQALHDRLAVGLAAPARRGFKLFGRMSREATDGPRGVYIHGGVGRGKSMLMDIFFETAPVTPKRRVHHHHFMQEAHGEINRALVSGQETGGDGGLVRYAQRLAEGARLLCFDDFHVTDIGDAMVLGPLFTALIEAGVIVVMTSNRTPDTLYENGINRARFVPFIELVKARLELVALDGPTDYRTRFISRSRLYHTPLTAAATVELERMFRHLSDGIPPEPETFTVKGRTLTIARTARGVAMASFEELCARPLGPADYIALQAAFHTVIVSDIPRMGPDMRNEAKRFVTLIDVLYEHRVNFICSAAAEPDVLYSEGAGVFEFARTTSRLNEMQTSGYIAEAHRI
ncbi:MAG: cell division protein ZapE [Proteobacteria bacterium]|nr:cell division protein ZapE [Pseudomonadota bacterium]MDA1356337.1 cell division protein ZapE [Pseudomonadota bacterium]